MTKAEKEYCKAAKRGNAKDKYNLGWMYQNGSEVPKNYRKAVKWYRKAAKQGDADAQNNMGWMYENGNGVRKSNVNAYLWYKRAMEQGQDKARANYNNLVQNMAPKARDRAEAKAEGKMAYVKQLIKSFLKSCISLIGMVTKIVVGVVILGGLCAFIILYLFPESSLTERILDVRDNVLNNTYYKWQGSQEGPPQIKLEKEDFTWLSGPLYGNETDTLSIRIKNYGGYVRDMTIELSSTLQGLSFPRSTTVPAIRKGDVKTVNIPISGDIDLPKTNASIDFLLNVPEWRGMTYKKRLSFETRKFRNPQLELAKWAVSETINEISDNQIKPNDNEKIDLEFYVQNKGCSAAEDVRIEVNNNQMGVTFLGIGDDYSKEPPTFSTIDAEEYKLITYHYLVTGDLEDSELKFEISATESFKKYGFDKQPVTVALDNLKSLERPEIHSCAEDPSKKLQVEDIDEESHQESQVIADRENDMQQDFWGPGMQIPHIDLEFLNLSDAEISGDMFTVPNSTAPFSTIKLEFSIQNVYSPIVKQVEVQVKNDQKGAVPIKSDPEKFSTIGLLERKPITYEYWIDGEEFNDHEFKFEIHVTYQYGDLDIDINGTKWETMEQKWEIKRQVDPYSEVEVISLP